MLTLLKKWFIREEKYDLVFGGVILIFTLLYKFLSAKYGLGWKFAAGFSYALFGLYLIYAIITKNNFLKKLLLFGLMAGIAELICDWYIVDINKTLIYYASEPMIWASPLYMPFSWADILVEIGFVGWLIEKEQKMWRTVLITGLIGAFFVPFFEHWAAVSNWWWYVNCKMTLDVPWYVVITETATCAVLPLAFKLIKKYGYATAFLLGIAEGLWMLVMAWITTNIIN